MGAPLKVRYVTPPPGCRRRWAGCFAPHRPANWFL